MVRRDDATCLIFARKIEKLSTAVQHAARVYSRCYHLMLAWCHILCPPEFSSLSQQAHVTVHHGAPISSASGRSLGIFGSRVCMLYIHGSLLPSIMCRLFHQPCHDRDEVSVGNETGLSNLCHHRSIMASKVFQHDHPSASIRRELHRHADGPHGRGQGSASSCSGCKSLPSSSIAARVRA